jgi:hypothetical protein
MIYVPSGWWHTVLNMEETIAVTQNFVDHANLCNVVSYLKFHKPDLHDKFLKNLEDKKPDVFSEYVGNKKSSWDKMMEEDEDDHNFLLF